LNSGSFDYKSNALPLRHASFTYIFARSFAHNLILLFEDRSVVDAAPTNQPTNEEDPSNQTSNHKNPKPPYIITESSLVTRHAPCTSI
jgi:hypothetical protein